MTKKQKQKIYNKWYFWACVVGVLAFLVLVLVLCLNGSSPGQRVTICTEMDYQGDIGPCIKTEEVKIVANPESASDCPTGTKPAYSVVGGIVGVKFVGCTK